MTGSATLAIWLLRQGLLDEWHLLVFPVVLGSGKRLFGGGGEKLPLKNHASWLPKFGVGARHPIAGPHSRFTVIESEGFADLGSGVNWVTWGLGGC